MTSNELFNQLITSIQSVEKFDAAESIRKLSSETDKGVDALDADDCRNLLKALLIKDIVLNYIAPLQKAEKILNGI